MLQRVSRAPDSILGSLGLVLLYKRKLVRNVQWSADEVFVKTTTNLVNKLIKAREEPNVVGKGKYYRKIKSDASLRTFVSRVAKYTR